MPDAPPPRDDVGHTVRLSMLAAIGTQVLMLGGMYMAATRIKWFRHQIRKFKRLSKEGPFYR